MARKKKHPVVEFPDWRIGLEVHLVSFTNKVIHGPYVVIKLEDEHVVLGKHYYSENYKNEKFSKLGHPFRISKTYCSRMGIPEIKYKLVQGVTKEWFVTSFAQNLIRDLGVMDLADNFVHSVSCNLTFN
jgi:hypothetical protein